MVYDNVLDAIKTIDPNNILLNCRTRAGFGIKHSKYIQVQMPDGTIESLSNRPPMNFYRGENGDYPKCKASIYRIANFEDRLIALLKTYHFIDFLDYTPEVQSFVLNNRYVSKWMLAQHYGFSTPLLDLTDELVTAAFFATHSFDKVIMNYVVKTNGVGVIRYCDNSLLKEPGKLKAVGIQPFLRPGQQDGYELWISEGDDFGNYSDRICFKQNSEINVKVNRAMLGGFDFFPIERITLSAKIIQESDLITSFAIENLLQDQARGNIYLGRKVLPSEVECILKKRGYHIVEAEIMPPDYQIPSNGIMKLRTLVERPAFRK